MAGQPFKVGRFAHSLRVRLMREHLGIDVDALSEEDLMSHHPSNPEYQQQPLKPEPEEGGKKGGVFHLKKSKQKNPIGVCALEVSQSKCSWGLPNMQTPTLVTTATMTDEEATSAETGKTFRHKNIIHGAAPSVGGRTLDEKRKDFNEKGQKIMGFAAVVRTLEEQAIIEKTPLKDQTDNGKHEATLNDQTIIEESESDSVQSRPVNGSGPHEPSTVDSVLLGASDVNSEERATASARATIRANIGGRKPWTVPTMKPKVEPQDFEDPISDAFWKNIWVASAVHNVSAFLLYWPSIIHSMLC